MKKIHSLLIVAFISFVSIKCSDSSTFPENKEKTIVNHFGQLKVSGKNIVDQNNEIVVLRGMSLFWSQWGDAYYNKETIAWLRDDWKCTVIRAAIGVEDGGYLETKDIQLQSLYRVIDACIDLGIYVIIDWHDHHAEEHLTQAKEFFGQVASKYSDYPNIIYEIYNEPLAVSWNDVLKPYAESVISEIRKYDTNNIIIVGTPNWSQDVEDVIGNRLDDNNVVYTFHFYAGTHGQSLRNKASQAITANIPLFVSEWGLSEASGSGNINTTSTNDWMAFLDQNNLSWCNWSIINKDETSAALLPTTSTFSDWDENDLSQSGKIIKSYLIERNSPIFDNLNN